MKKFKKIIKILTLSFAIVFTLTLVSGVTFFITTTKGVSLDTNKLDKLSTAKNLKVYDSSNKIISPSNKNHIQVSKLSSHTKNAFIAAEDK
ncbi:MAG: hypothetical protein J6J33_01110 [Clostridia bacterium]|nr:hypothetical protein [Clostridia bacterium]